MTQLRSSCFFHHVLLFITAVSSSQASSKYDSIYSFGDSYVDTGNFVILNGTDTVYDHLPYGITIGKPTGRCSDGRVIVDFFAERLGLPLLPPSLSKNASFVHGANFATALARALDLDFFLSNNITGIVTFNATIGDQVDWFEKMKPAEHFSTSLFYVGEVGYNDYLLMILRGQGLAYAMSHISLVVDRISVALERLIVNGARTVAVSGLMPLGCSPAYLTLFASANKTDYDPATGCLKAFNLLSIDHNKKLKNVLGKLKAKHHGVRLVYADIYEPLIQFIKFPDRYGFNASSGAFWSCCGGGGPYNFNASAQCGAPGTTACADPSVYVNWDGVHLTEASYRRIADGWLDGPYAHPPILD